MIVLITGGASGLGEAITRKIAQNKQYLVYFTYSSSDANAHKIESDYNNAISIKCDFRNDIDVSSLKTKIPELKIDALINNAYFGSFIHSYFHKISENDFLGEFKNNVLPTIAITQSAINCFRKNKHGKIISILTSALINTPPIGSSVYVANKAYMKELTKIWAIENAKFNITSNSVSPAFMQTNFTVDVDERMIEQIINNNPQKKILTVEEVAETVLFLVRASSQINGIDIVINAAINIK